MIAGIMLLFILLALGPVASKIPAAVLAGAVTRVAGMGGGGGGALFANWAATVVVELFDWRGGGIHICFACRYFLGMG